MSLLKSSYFYRRPRLWILAVLLAGVILTQCIPSWGECYAQRIYPCIASVLSAASSLFPFAVGDLFIFLLIIGLVIYPLLVGVRQKRKWRFVALVEVECLVWLYVWFYVAWGLNYSQKDFYERTGIARVEYTPERFRSFANGFIAKLNAQYTDVTYMDKTLVKTEVVAAYNVICDVFGVSRPLLDSPVGGNGIVEQPETVRRTIHCEPRAKTMLFSALASKVGVTGSMSPLFCEFTLNAYLPPYQYPATYAHELAHFLGITSEAEASFYAYQACTRSEVKSIRFSGYFALLQHVLGNARQVMSESEYAALAGRIRPEVIALLKENRRYWNERYSPSWGKVQDKLYDLYLKGNKIESGTKNYSEVVGLLISAEATQ